MGAVILKITYCQFINILIRILPKMDDEHNKVYGHLEALKREISSNIQEKL